MVMSFIENFLWGMLAVGLGILILKFNYQLVGFTGRQDWIESKLGQGSTYLAYKLFAVMLVLGGLVVALGLSDLVFGWLLSPLRGLLPESLGGNPSL